MPFLAIIGILAFAWCWHLVLTEIDYRIRARRLWPAIKRRIEEEDARRQ